MLKENLASTMDGTRVPTAALVPTSMCQNSAPSSPITQFYSINKCCIGWGGMYEWAFVVEGTLTLARPHGGFFSFTPCFLCVMPTNEFDRRIEMHCRKVWTTHPTLRQTNISPLLRDTSQNVGVWHFWHSFFENVSCQIPWAHCQYWDRYNCDR
jgi:hypothetical protein